MRIISCTDEAAVVLRQKIIHLMHVHKVERIKEDEGKNARVLTLDEMRNDPTIQKELSENGYARLSYSYKKDDLFYGRLLLSLEHGYYNEDKEFLARTEWITGPYLEPLTSLCMMKLIRFLPESMLDQFTIR